MIRTISIPFRFEQEIVADALSRQLDQWRFQRGPARRRRLPLEGDDRARTEQQQKRDKEKDANNVEDVWKRGYGDGVQLNWLYL